MQSYQKKLDFKVSYLVASIAAALVVASLLLVALVSVAALKFRISFAF